MNILDIGQIRDYSIALFMYKMSNGMLPSMFEIMFIQTSDVHSYTSRLCNKHFQTKIEIFPIVMIFLSFFIAFPLFVSFFLLPHLFFPSFS